MKTLRQVHLYLGCLFAPLIIYFSISGAWQVFRLNDVPKGEPAPMLRSVLHAVSNPHTHSTFPGMSPRESQSESFNWIAAVMGLGMAVTSVLGIVLAARFSKRKLLVAFCLGAGVVLPFLALLARA